MKIAVLGIGSVRCAAPVIASLAGYFGERPLEIGLWDSDAERLDLFDRFARTCFLLTRSKHTLMASEDEEEVLADSTGVVLAVGENCARKYLLRRGSLLGHGETSSILVQRCASELLAGASLDTRVLSLIPVEPDGHLWDSVAWPDEPTEQERKSLPHQVLRYVHGDEYAHALIKEFSASPVTVWLDGLTALQR
jgi:hypothetical protein